MNDTERAAYVSNHEDYIFQREDGSQVLVEVWPDCVIVKERADKFRSWGPPKEARRG